MTKMDCPQPFSAKPPGDAARVAAVASPAGQVHKQAFGRRRGTTPARSPCRHEHYASETGLASHKKPYRQAYK